MTLLKHALRSGIQIDRRCSLSKYSVREAEVLAPNGSAAVIETLKDAPETGSVGRRGVPVIRPVAG